jgi:hypothetical protein
VDWQRGHNILFPCARVSAQPGVRVGAVLLQILVMPASGAAVSCKEPSMVTAIMLQQLARQEG